MPALNTKAIIAMQDNLRDMAKDIASISEVTITPQEIIEMFIKPEDVDVCRRAAQLTRKYGDSIIYQSLKLAYGEVGLNISMSSERIMIPDEKHRNYAPHPARDRLYEWLSERIEIGYRYGQIGQLIVRINQICDHAKQIKYFWPGLYQLMYHPNKRSELEHLKERWMTLECPKNVPAIAPTIRKAIAEASAAITMARLAGPSKDAGKVKLTGFCKIEVTYVTPKGDKKTPWGEKADFY